MTPCSGPLFVPPGRTTRPLIVPFFQAWKFTLVASISRPTGRVWSLGNMVLPVIAALTFTFFVWNCESSDTLTSIE